MNEPGEFYNEEQRKYVHDILRAIGWKKSHKGHWYDEKIRDKEGNWLVKFETMSKYQSGSVSKYTKYIMNQLNGQIPTIDYKVKEPYFTQEQIKDIQKKFFLKRYSAPYLEKLYQCDGIEVLWVIQMTYKRVKEHMKRNETNSRTNKST